MPIYLKSTRLLEPDHTIFSPKRISLDFHIPLFVTVTVHLTVQEIIFKTISILFKYEKKAG